MVARKYGVVYTPDRLADFAAELLCSEIEESKFDNIFHYWVKHFEEPSEDYGMDGGRISKLMLKRDGEIAYNYDRGLNIPPADQETEMALAILMKEYN